MTYKIKDVAPRPWTYKNVVKDLGGGLEFNHHLVGIQHDSSWQPICDAYINSPNANMQHIVQCVNNHETLVALVEQLMDTLEICHGTYDDNKTYELLRKEIESDLAEATEALNKIKKDK